MPFKTIPNTNVTYALIGFDAEGRERTDDPEGVNGQMSARILQEAAKTSRITSSFSATDGRATFPPPLTSTIDGSRL